MIIAGIDLGSTAIKLALVADGQLLWHKAAPTAPGQEKIADNLLTEGLAAVGRSGETVVRAVTGYGKHLLVGADRVIDELTANRLGVCKASDGRARSLINIGGQDVKVIRLSAKGQMTGFKMNDKCAAGCGRFFEVAARILDTEVGSFATLAANAAEAARINSTCAVFAESEIVSLMAQGVVKENIIAGLHQSVARRIAGLCAGGALEDDIYLDGGAAQNPGLVHALEDELCRDLHVLPLPQFTVAYGAAISAAMADSAAAKNSS
ncbi:MAG: acyl-CoA dehydratase activase [Desulfobulbaceae bacterium]|jgi:predicted CoA-substrate-specific enzyme activase|nr:acyl-CoA dehydratase activase [Desulfobulbaceae bacterium]